MSMKPEDKDVEQLADTRKFALSAAKARLSELIDEVRTTGEPVVIQRRSKPAAVLVGVAEYEEMSRLRDTYRAARLRKALKGKRHDLDDVLAGLDLEL